MADTRIGTLKESSLHAALKAWYAAPGDGVEVEVEGYVIDLVRGDRLIEIQTGNFWSLRDKLERLLLAGYAVRVVYPLVVERRIMRIATKGQALSQRQSPKHAKPHEIFNELIHIPNLARHPNFSLEILGIHEALVLRNDGQGSWRRKGWSVADRLLLAVVSSTVFGSLQDYRQLLPEQLPSPFTVSELAAAAGLPRRLAGKMAYTLRQMGLLAPLGQRGRAMLYSIALENLSQA